MENVVASTFVERRLSQLIGESYAAPGKNSGKRRPTWAQIALVASPICEELHDLVVAASSTTAVKKPELYAEIKRLADVLGAIYQTQGGLLVDDVASAMRYDAITGDRPMTPSEQAWQVVSCRLNGLKPLPRYSRE